MLGRQNKNLVVRLLKVPLKSFSKPVYHIVVAKKRSKPTSRLDRLGSVGLKQPYTFLRLDFTKLNKYLINKNVKIADNVWKVLGLDDYIRLLVYKPKRVAGMPTLCDKLICTRTKRYLKNSRISVPAVKVYGRKIRPSGVGI